MGPTIANAAVQPVSGAEVVCCNIAGGPFDNVDAYVQGGAWSGGQLLFKLYATVGAVTGVVAIATYSGPQPARLQWQEVETDLSSVHAGGTVYTLKVYGQAPQFGSQNQALLIGPAAIAVTLAGVNSSDTVPVTNSSATVNVTGAGAETTVTTAAGFIESADVLANMTGAPPLVFTIYADCGGGSVVAPIASVQTGGSDALAAVLREVPLSVATNYTLKVKKVIQDGVTTAITAALATYAVAAGGGGGAIPLAPEVSGPSNNNVVTGPFSQASLKWKATVLAASLGTNVALATFSLLFDLAIPALTFDPVNGDTFFDVGGVERAKISLAHGVGTFGSGEGTGADFYVALGPRTGAEVAEAAVWILPNGVARTANNWAMDGDGNNLFFSTRGINGVFEWYNANTGQIGQLDNKAFTLFANTTEPVAAAARVKVYVDNVDNALKAIGESGDITILAVP